jgi:hypothetical protein
VPLVAVLAPELWGGARARIFGALPRELRQAFWASVEEETAP